MQVSSIQNNTQNFTSKSEQKKRDKSSNMGKFIGLGVGVGSITEKLTMHGGLKNFKDTYRDEVIKAIQKETSVKVHDLDTPFFKNLVRKKTLTYLSVVMGCWIGVGAIYDETVNIYRRQKANGKLP